MTHVPKSNILQPILTSSIDTHPIDAIIFDWDETFVKSQEFYVNVKQEVIKRLKKRGVELKEEHKNTDAAAIQADYHNHVNADALLTYYFGKENLDTAREIYLATLEEFDKNYPVELLAGAKETLDLLDSLDIPYAFATNSQQKRIETKAAEVFPDKGASMIVVGSQEGRKGKPETDIVEEALKQLKEKYSDKKFHNENILFVGDNHINDIVPAHTLGMKPVLFSDIEKDKFHSLNPSEDYPQEVGYVRDHTDLQQYIKHQLGLDATTQRVSQPSQQQR